MYNNDTLNHIVYVKYPLILTIFNNNCLYNKFLIINFYFNICNKLRKNFLQNVTKSCEKIQIIFMTIIMMSMFILKEYNCCYTLNYNYDIR